MRCDALLQGLGWQPVDARHADAVRRGAAPFAELLADPPTKPAANQTALVHALAWRADALRPLGCLGRSADALAAAHDLVPGLAPGAAGTRARASVV